MSWICISYRVRHKSLHTICLITADVSSIGQWKLINFEQLFHLSEKTVRNYCKMAIMNFFLCGRYQYNINFWIMNICFLWWWHCTVNNKHILIFLHALLLLFLFLFYLFDLLEFRLNIIIYRHIFFSRFSSNFPFLSHNWPLCLFICFSFTLANLVSISFLWLICAAPNDTSSFFSSKFQTVFLPKQNKFNLILFSTLLMGNHLKTTSVNLYFPPENMYISLLLFI